MIDARDTALVIEGGGMRNSYTAASIVHLLEKQVQFGWVGGVSAGASHTVNFLSGDKERARSSFTDFANNPSFGGVSHFLRGRGYFNAEFIYEKAADKDLPFDWKTFTESSAQVCISATRADTGETVNWGRQDMPSLPDLMMRVRASSTLPLIMPMRLIDDVPFVDGALGDSGGVVVNEAERAGFRKILFLATKPRDYVRPATQREGFLRRAFFKHPAVAKAMIERPDKYNAAKDRLLTLEKQGRAQLFFPTDLSVESTERDAEKLLHSYRMGQIQTEKEWPQWEEFLTD
ncbi:patatin family protein [Corynebacterium pseudodiphtheriticum]|uniref:patatin-like phospholipase family protein n=1 Tax=Corynebacterium pseudodiphtheriticum TaxID=37637 RepID=UPI00234E1C1F|nr:patatin family protein [Corynebacterium pseudodiphtheriticum]MDC7112867.1 patatin family protein [Corynebacterium pseudodiphtheriticum]